MRVVTLIIIALSAGATMQSHEFNPAEVQADADVPAPSVWIWE